MEFQNMYQAVRTFQPSGLVNLQNENCLINTFNKKFLNFQNLTGQKGDTVLLQLPYRATVNHSLKAVFQPIIQRPFPLTVDGEVSSSFAATTEEIVYNQDNWKEERLGAAFVAVGADIESACAQEFEKSGYRFYGDGNSPVNSYQQLATIAAYDRMYGTTSDELEFYLPMHVIPPIIGSGLNQFVPARNNKAAENWLVAEFDQCRFYKSNVLPTHTAGTLGQNGTVLTVVSTTENAAGAITSITFSGAGTDADAVKKYDMVQFLVGPNIRTFTGHVPLPLKAQFMAAADAASNGGNVTITLQHPLVYQPGEDQYITENVVAGMTVKIANSHIKGGVVKNKGAFLAMPRLPQLPPYPTRADYDNDTGASIRVSYGSNLENKTTGWSVDSIYQPKIVDDNFFQILFPLNA